MTADLSPDAVARIRARLLDGAGRPGSVLTPASVAAAVRDEGRVLGDADVLALTARLGAELTGFGPLEPLLQLAGVTDVLVNRWDDVWVDCGDGLRRTSVAFADEVAVRRLAQRLAGSAGRRLDDAAPTVDALLPGGIRLHAALPPVAVGGTAVSLRIPAPVTWTLPRLESAGAVSTGLARRLRRLVEQRISFLVTGGTGTGKTSVLAALLGLVPAGERIVVVEDAAELRPEHPHVVSLQARHANVEGAGTVTLDDLVRQALRMRPDRLVVGEVRGAEVVALLAALNTGHAGGAGTVHAGDPAALPARVEALAGAGGLPREAAHSQLAAAVGAVVHLCRDGPDRRVAGIWRLRRGEDGLVRAAPAYDEEGCSVRPEVEAPE